MKLQTSTAPMQIHGLSSYTPSVWGPKKLGATWVFDPALLTVSGNNITAAKNAGGSLLTLTAASGNEPVITTAGPFGKTSIRTSNVNTKLISATGGPTGATPWHQIAIVQYNGFATGPASYCTFFQVGDTAPSASNYGFGANTSSIYPGGNNYQSGAFSAPENDLTFTRIIELIYDGGTSLTTWVNGKLYATFSHTFNIPSSVFGFINFAPGPTYPVVDVRVDSLALKVGGNWTRAQIQQWLKYELKRLGGTGKVLTCFGDSTTAGTGTAYQALPPAIRGHQTGSIVIFEQNEGISSQRSDQILLRINNFSNPTTHWTIWMGINDIAQGLPGGQTSTGNVNSDAAIIYNNFISAVAKGHQLGVKVVVGTLYQWGAAASSPSGYQEQTRLALNTLIRANTAGADDVADIDATLGPYNSVNFLPDTLHMTGDVCVNIVSPVFYSKLVTVG